MSKNYSLIDTVVILLGGSTLTVFVIWLAASVAGYPILQSLPPWLEKVASSAWTWLTGTAGAGALLARQLKKPAKDRPNYLAAIAVTSVAQIGLVFLVMQLIARPQTDVNLAGFSLRFALTPQGDSDTRPQLSMLPQRPIAMMPTGLAPLADNSGVFYNTPITLPGRGQDFYASVHRTVIESRLITGTYFITDWPICFLRKPRDPAPENRAKSIALKCEEGKGCVVDDSSGDSWAVNCPDARAFFPVVYAQGPPLPASGKSWAVPSLPVLKQLHQEKGIGYTDFLIKSQPIASLGAGDYFTYEIRVNGAVLLVDGWKSENLRVPVDASSKTLQLGFGLQNLDFSGADAGCETIEVKFKLVRQGGATEEFTLYRGYAALRDASSVDLAAPNGMRFTWTGQYVHPRNEGRSEVFVASTDGRGAAQIKERIDQAGLRVNGRELVAVIRPPLEGPTFGVVAGFKEPTGQVQFTFNSQAASEALRQISMLRADPANAAARRAFPVPPFVYTLRGDDRTNLRICVAAGAR